MATRIQVRRDTAANWTATNPILAEGELGLELDTLKFKAGNGTSDWKTLNYCGSSTVATTAIHGTVQLADAAAITAGTAGRVVDAAQLKANVPVIADASTTAKGVVQLADATAVTAGTAGRVVDAAQLKAAVDAENLWDRTGAVVSPTNSGDVVSFSAGTAALPGLTPVGDPNTGIFSPAPDEFAISTNGTDRVSVGSTGIVEIDKARCAAGGGIDFLPSSANRVVLRCRTTVNSSTSLISFYNSNGLVGSIGTNGTATAYATSSDYRLKENIVAVTDGIARLQQLKPSRFNFKVDPSWTVDGFIAHEVQTVIPEAVIGTKDEVDSDGNPVYQGIDQSKLVPLLTAALQEAIAKIETLEARLTAAGL